MSIENGKYGLAGGTKEEFLETLKALKGDIDTYIGEHTWGNRKSLIMNSFKVAFWQDKRDSNKFHPSEISRGDYCKRKLYYDYSGEEKDNLMAGHVDSQLQRLFDLGTMVHLYMQYNLIEQGEMQDFEVGVRSKLMNVSGLLDGNNDVYVHEIKTITTFKFSKLKKPLKEHIRQASLYAFFDGKTKLRFIYYDKNSSAIKVFDTDLDYTFIEEFQEVVIELKKLHKKNKKNKNAKEVVYPERVCTNRLFTKALECPHANKCFK